MNRPMDFERWINTRPDSDKLVALFQATAELEADGEGWTKVAERALAEDYWSKIFRSGYEFPATLKIDKERFYDTDGAVYRFMSRVNKVCMPEQYVAMVFEEWQNEYVERTILENKPLLAIVMGRMKKFLGKLL